MHSPMNVKFQNYICTMHIGKQKMIQTSMILLTGLIAFSAKGI